MARVTAALAGRSAKPRSCSDCSKLLSAGEKPEVRSAMWLWCKAARRSQKVVTSDIEKLAAMMRAKFDRPEAEGIFSVGTPSSRMLMVAMKKEPEEIPCTISV